jgi:hypothetical protein
MKKSIYLFLAVLIVTVIAILWTRVFIRGSGSQEQLSGYPLHVGEDMRKPHQEYGLLLDTLPNNVELSVNEDKNKDVAGEVEEIQDKQVYATNDVLVDQSKGNESQESHAVIQDDQAIAIARKVIGDIRYDEKGEIRVDRLEGKIRVVFPFRKRTPPPGMRSTGPDYAAEVYIDAESGEVLLTLQGS